MAADELDRIHIRDLLLRCIIGVREWERQQLQDVLIDITLYADLSAACRGDHLEDTVDYVTVNKRVIRLVEASSFQLIERLAEAVAEACLLEPRVRRVDVMVSKPGALRFARTVAVQITRTRAEDGLG